MGVDIERGNWHLDKRFSVGNILLTLGMLGSLFAYFVHAENALQEEIGLATKTAEVSRVSVLKHETLVDSQVQGIESELIKINTKINRMDTRQQTAVMRQEDKLDEMMRFLRDRNNGDRHDPGP